MGCDIHLFVEYRPGSCGPWALFGLKFKPNRNYDLFGILSKGVRSEYEFSYCKRGLPSDVTRLVKEESREPENHSHSWLYTEEFDSALKHWNRIGDFKEPEYEAVLAAMEKLQEFEFESRIVFWFNN